MASLLKRFLAWDAGATRRLGVAHQTGALRSFAAFFARSGDSWFWFLGLATVWLLGDAYWKSRALALAGGVFITAVLVLAIKFTIRRRRPEGSWGGVYRATDPHSFPSGHATRAMMIAIMALGMGPSWLGMLLLLWAPLVTLARVAMGVHYLSDVLAGFVLGAFLGWANLHLFANLF